MKNMPIKDLPGYLESIQGKDQEYVPVVEMGNIEMPNYWFRRLSIFAGVVLFLALASFSTYSNMTKTIIIETSNSDRIADAVESYGASVRSVRKNDDDSYEVRIFSFKNIGLLIEKLRKNKEFKKVELL